MVLTIKDELQNLMPVLTTDEYTILRESIIVDGCRDSIVIWEHDDENIIVDGHNRYEICLENNIRFNTKPIEANNIDDIKIWMIDNAKGRRNLTDGWKFELAQTRKGILLKQGREKQGHGQTAPGKTLLSTIDKSDIKSKEPLSTIDKPSRR